MSYVTASTNAFPQGPPLLHILLILACCWGPKSFLLFISWPGNWTFFQAFDDLSFKHECHGHDRKEGIGKLGSLYPPTGAATGKTERRGSATWLFLQRKAA
eukprot:scaffold170193_cov14-Tisochrysis_lutea.AAC.1